MPRSTRSAYSDAAGWARSRMPRRPARADLAAKVLGAFLLDATLLLSVIGLFSPASFGASGSRAFGSNVRTLMLGGLVAACALSLARRWRTQRRAIEGVREPFRHPIEDDPAFAPASTALAAARPPLQTRFAVAWIWLPALAVAGAGATSLAAAYFVVDAVVARFEIGWQQPVLAAVNLLLAWVLLRISAGRLAVWPLAVSVHREATTGYS